MTDLSKLHLKTDEALVNVHLGPEWLMTEQINRVEIEKGRELEVTGSGNVVAGAPCLRRLGNSGRAAERTIATAPS